MPFIYNDRKKYKFRYPHQPPLYPQTSNFILNIPHSWTSLTGIPSSYIQGNFEIFLENFNSEINIMT